MHIKEGDLVVFRNGLYEDEQGAVYRVAEVNGDRCFLELINTSMPIRPQTLAQVADLEVVVNPSSL